MLADILLHFVLGLIGAGIGFYARGFCKHPRHQVALTLSLVLVESIAMVGVIG